MLSQQGQVLPGPVAFVFLEIVLREFLMQFQHQPVTGYLGEDRGRRNTVAPVIAFYEWFLRDRNSRQSERINQQIVRPGEEGFERPFHGNNGRLENVHIIDGPLVDYTDTIAD